MSRRSLSSSKRDSLTSENEHAGMVGNPIASHTLEGCEGPYFDFLNVPFRIVKARLTTPKQKRKGPRGGVSEPFPVKLYEMLVGVEQSGDTQVVSWRNHGRCFHIECPRSFVRDIMPTYFKQSKLTSFQRQLNLYGFQKVSCSRDRGSYFHPLFLRGRPDLCGIMLRTRVKGGVGEIMPSPESQSVSQTKANFHSLPPCPPLSVGNPEGDSALLPSTEENDTSPGMASGPEYAAGEQCTEPAEVEPTVMYSSQVRALGAWEEPMQRQPPYHLPPPVDDSFYHRFPYHSSSHHQYLPSPHPESANSSSNHNTHGRYPEGDYGYETGPSQIRLSPVSSKGATIVSEEDPVDFAGRKFQCVDDQNLGELF